MEQTLINGHEAVDLGLPSGTIWATCNVGATKPEEYGDYFAWGETTPKSVYNRDTYKYGSDDDSINNYYTYSWCGIFENRSELALCYDAATVNWGKAWRMPTRSQWKELHQYCTWTWTSMNGVNGRLVVGPNGKSIFLPAAEYRYKSDPILAEGKQGCYWSSSLNLDSPDYAYHIVFGSDGFSWGSSGRCCGLSVRPVLAPSKRRFPQRMGRRCIIKIESNKK